MNLMQSWKESVGLLMPQNLKPFLLVTAKTVLDVYKSINKPLTSKGNWIVALVLVVLIGLTNVIKMFHLFLIEAILLNGMLHFLFFIFLLGMRPSVDVKNWNYFERYLKKYWYLFIITIALGISHVYIIPFIFIAYLLFLLFAFDSHGSGQEIIIAIKNSFKMIVFNFPVFFILFGVLGIINLILYFLVAFALGYFGGLTIASILYIIFVPIEVAFITNLYIKFLHGQPSLYFKQPE